MKLAKCVEETANSSIQLTALAKLTHIFAYTYAKQQSSLRPRDFLAPRCLLGLKTKYLIGLGVELLRNVWCKWHWPHSSCLMIGVGTLWRVWETESLLSAMLESGEIATKNPDSSRCGEK